MDSQAEFLARTSQDAKKLISRVKSSSMSDLCDANYESIRAAAKVISQGKERECRETAMTFYAEADDLFDDLIGLTYEEIHDSMSSFGSLFTYFESSMGDVQHLIKDFSEISRLFTTMEPDTIHQLRMRALHLTEVLKVLTSLQHVIDASSEIDSLMSVSKYKEAAECMMRARFVIQQPDFNNFDALDGFKKVLAELFDSTFDRMYVILDREIYSCIGSLAVVPLSKPSKPPASFEIASKDVHNMRIRTLLEAIQILGAEKVEALMENLMLDLRNHLQSQIESLLDVALLVSTLSADTSSDPLAEFLSTVLCNSILVLKQHAFVLSEMQNINVHTRGTSYSIASVWIVMQSEIQKLVTRYIQPSASACEALYFLSSSSANSSKVHMYVEPGYGFVDRPEQNALEQTAFETLSFSLPSARLEMLNSVTSPHEQDAASANNNKDVELVNASPYRILSIFNILKSFSSTCTSILSIGGSNVLQDQELLDIYLDQYLSDEFIPFILAEYKYRVSEACRSADIFLTIHALTTLPTRDTFGAVMEVSAVIDAMFEEVIAIAAVIPDFMGELNLVCEAIVLRYLDIAQEHFDRVLSNTKIPYILSRSDLLGLLQCDPLFMSLRSLAQETPHFPEISAFASLERLRIDPELLQISLRYNSADAIAFLDISGIALLSNLYSSMNWLASRIRSRSAFLFRTSSSQVNSKPEPVRGIAIPKVSSNSLASVVKCFRQDNRRGFIDANFQGVIDDLASRCERMAQNSLLSLRLLFRCQVFLHFSSIVPSMFLRDSAISVPDTFALQLSRQLNIVHDLLQSLLPKTTVYYVFASIPALISYALMEKVATLESRNAFGVSSMLKNVHCIKQTLLSLPLFEQSPTLVMNFLKRATLYFELMELDQDDLLEQIEQSFGMGFSEAEISVLIRLSAHLQSHEVALKRLQTIFSTISNPMGIMSSMGAGIDKHVDMLTDALSSTFRGVDKVVGVTIDGLTAATKVTIDGITSASEAVRDGLVKTGGAVSKALRRPLHAPNAMN